MKSLKILGDKYDYIISKQEYYEKLVDMFRNLKGSNEYPKEYKEVDKIKIDISLQHNKSEFSKEDEEIQDMFRKFNTHKEIADNIVKDLKNTFSDNKVEFKSINEIEFNFELNNERIKENYLRNEIMRLQKENIAIRFELNFLYDQIKVENKLYELKEIGGGVKKKYQSNNKNKNTGHQSNNTNNSNNNIFINQNNNLNTSIFVKIDNDNNTEEIYFSYRNFINRMRLTEFII